MNKRQDNKKTYREIPKNSYSIDKWFNGISAALLVLFLIVKMRNYEHQKDTELAQSSPSPIKHQDLAPEKALVPHPAKNRLYYISIGLLSILFAMIGVWIVNLTTATKAGSTITPASFTWSWNPYELSNYYEPSLSIKILPNTTNVEVYLETERKNVDDPPLGENIMPSNTLPYDYSSRQFTFVWPGEIDSLDSSNYDLNPEIKSKSEDKRRPGTMVSGNGYSHFQWLNGVQQISYAEYKLVLRFGDIVDSNWHANPFVQPYGNLKIEVELPPNYKILSETPQPNVLWTSTNDAYYGEGRVTRTYVIEVGRGIEAIEASTDLEIVVENTSLARSRDFFVLLAGLILGLSANLLTELVIFSLSRVWRYKTI